MNIQTFSTESSSYQRHLLPYWHTGQQFARKRIVLGSKQHKIIVTITKLKAKRQLPPSWYKSVESQFLLLKKTGIMIGLDANISMFDGKLDL